MPWLWPVRLTLLIADDPTTALDVTLQAQIMNLIVELRAEMGMSHAREMIRLRPDACYQELVDCGHCPLLEYPETVAGLLGPWLLEQSKKSTGDGSK